MNQLDMIALAVVVVSALLGLSRGLVREVLGLGSWLAAAWAAYVFGPQLIPQATKIIGNDVLVVNIAAYGITFILALIVCSLVANLLGRRTRLSMLGGLDRTLGMVFGAIRGEALLIAAYILGSIAVAPAQWPPYVRDARVIPFLYDGAKKIVSYLPADRRPNIAAPGDTPATNFDDLLHASPSGSALQPSAPKTKL